MALTQEQTELVRGWAASGKGLSEIQKQLERDLDIRMTYMQLRFFLDDNNIELGSPAKATPQPKPAEVEPEEADEVEELLPAGVSVSVDRLKMPGTMMSGQVTFSDGVSAKWYLDQMGRLGLDCADKNYRPVQEDVREFQMELQRLFQQQGLQ